jgi:restriction system protein
MEVLQQLEWRRFEVVCTEFLNTLGFQAKETKTGADGGVDIVLHRTGDSRPMAIAQCKAWRTRPVGVKPVRELYGVMAAEKVEHGIFLTTSAYTQEASEFAAGKNLELVDGAKLMAFIGQLNATAQAGLLAKAFEGDYSTPTCPRCDVKMTLRTSRKGPQAGSEFWGCPTIRGVGRRSKSQASLVTVKTR